jgi:hypothetical protein
MVDSSNLNFDLAKKQVIHGLEKLARFSSNMDENYPTCRFAQFVRRLAKKEMFQDTLNALKLSLESTHQVQSVTNEIVDAVLSQTKNILSMISILLAVIIMVEAHEYDIQNMIATAKKYFQQYVTLTVKAEQPAT